MRMLQILLGLFFVATAAFGQINVNVPQIQNFGEKTLSYLGAYQEGMQLGEFIDETHPIVFIIQDEIYLPDSRCVCDRLKGMDSEGRNRGSGRAGRSSGDDDSGRKRGDDDSGRGSGNDGTGRGSGDDDSGRASGADSVSRADLDDEEGRAGGTDGTGRNSGDGSIGRGAGLDDSGRDMGNDDSSRRGGSQAEGRSSNSETTRIKCKKIKKSCDMIVEGIHPNAKFFMYDGSLLLEVTKSMDDKGVILKF